MAIEELPAVDVHMHPWRSAHLLELDPEGFEDRTTMMGMCQLTSGRGSDLLSRIEAFTESTPFALKLRRDLARLFGVEPTRQAVARARMSAFSADPAAYVGSLLSDANIAGVFYDEGYPQPTMSFEEFQAECPTTRFRVARLEPWVDQIRGSVADFDELAHLFSDKVREALADENLVAFKSVIAYRTGLDIGNPDLDTCRSAFTGWKNDGFRESREFSKPIRDRLLRKAFDLASDRRVPIHIHSGGGDPDVLLKYARPANIFDLLTDYSSHPVVLIHAGNPWIEEAAYLASILPEVYIDTSVMVPWHSLAIDQKLEVLLGVAPPAKIMYGSDEASEPEVLWQSAHIMRASLRRVLDKAVKDGWFTDDDSVNIARGVLGENALTLHRGKI
ncbi:amidohydrolase family protein [Streptomyces sp. NBC_00878]|uniref:amidohydrolase family protein n=1 Tax=Streptomyces sp. NBC_00878 TaxID=2975854 RepID=UPI002255D6C9|nr:amidohydrolase family protein [Streptomyces sp. NBC_00878]MCX4910769.1 amidohydrolase family protein [Streptomyces sp. NBC_00878]